MMLSLQYIQIKYPRQRNVDTRKKEMVSIPPLFMSVLALSSECANIMLA